MSEKFYHYTNNPTLKFHNGRQIKSAWPWSVGKPDGLWFSTETKDGWKSWVGDEDYRFPSRLGKYKYEVKLKTGAKVLYIANAKELDKFTAEFQEPSGSSYLGRMIDWQKVAKKFDGIVIVPYIAERRMTPSSSWYYGWDVASGCVWRKRAIESITLVKTDDLSRTA